MRFALRNREKIDAVKGQGYYKALLDSLNEHVRASPKLDLFDDENYPGYPMFQVLNKSDNKQKFQFALVGQKFDICNVAFCKTIDL